MTLLRLSRGSVTYPNGFDAVKSVDLEVSAGEFLVLLGPSGAGKSTLLRALNGLVTLSSGEVELVGIGSINSGAKMYSLRKQTGMVFQQHQLIGRLSALTNVLTGRLGFYGAAYAFLSLPHTDRLIALEALDRVGVLECALARVDQLSGGQQQRVGLARALAQRPQLLLADEPVASLDPSTAVKVLGLLHEICKADKIAAIVSLHQLHLAERFADRIVGIAEGRTVFDGTTKDLDETALSLIYGPESRETRARPHLSQRQFQRRA